jgi:SAM-dependent methyltransferase
MDFHFERRSEILATTRQLYRNSSKRHRILQGLRPYICPFADLLEWVPNDAYVLDVGCGAGLFLGLVGKAYPEATGIGFDADAPAIGAAEAMARTHFLDGRIAFRRLDISDSWPTGPFGVVSIIDVLHHIRPAAQRQAIEQSYAYVRPGGRLLYKDMADRPFFHACWNRLHDIVVARQWIHYRSADEVEAWLRGMGAQIEHRSLRFLGPYAHELIVAAKPA